MPDNQLTDEDIRRVLEAAKRASEAGTIVRVTNLQAFCAFLSSVGLESIANSLKLTVWGWDAVKTVLRSVFSSSSSPPTYKLKFARLHYNMQRHAWVANVGRLDSELPELVWRCKESGEVSEAIGKLMESHDITSLTRIEIRDNASNTRVRADELIKSREIIVHKDVRGWLFQTTFVSRKTSYRVGPVMRMGNSGFLSLYDIRRKLMNTYGIHSDRIVEDDDFFTPF